MKYIIQTLPYAVFDEEDKINKLFDLGLELLHIRKPLYSKKQIKQFIAKIEEKYHSKIVLHSHFSLLSSFNLKGIHVEFSALSNLLKKMYYRFLKKKYSITVSTTTSKILKNKLSDNLLDYIFLGPVFVKFSEESIVQKINSFELKKDLSIVNKKIFATGCVNLNNINTVNQIGFAGSVLQSYIWKSEDIINTFSALKLNQSEYIPSSSEVAI